MADKRKPYTGFGRFIRQLMWQRDVRSWTSLSELIEATTGNTYSHQSMSKYATGITQIPPEFVQDFARTLELTEAERLDLAEQYAYHSRQKEARRHTA